MTNWLRTCGQSRTINFSLTVAEKTHPGGNIEQWEKIPLGDRDAHCRSPPRLRRSRRAHESDEDWSDGKRIEPADFHLSLIPGGTVFWVEFRVVGESVAFARAFGGKVIIEPDGHPLAA